MALTPMAEDGVWVTRGPTLRAEVKKNPALYGRENPVDVPVYVVGEDAIKRVLSQGWMLIDDPRVDASVSPEAAPDPEPVDPELEAAAETARYQALRETGARAEADMRQHTPAAPAPAARPKR